MFKNVNMLKVLCEESVHGTCTYIYVHMFVSGFHTGVFGRGEGEGEGLRMGSYVC